MERTKCTLYAISPCEDGKASYDDNKFCFHFKPDVSSFEDTAVLHIDEYEKLFGKKRNSTNAFCKRLSVVKITYMDDNGRKWSVYRKFRPSYMNQSKGKVAVSYHTPLFLKDEEGSILGKDVSIQKSNFINFYLTHPNEVVQISLVLALWSLVLGILSIILSLI